MKITITNDGVKGVDAITIFLRDEMNSINHHCIEGNETYTLDWDPTSSVRYEIVPWIRIPPALTE